MKTYPNGSGEWIDHNGCRVEVYHDGSWVVYTLSGEFRSLSSAKMGGGKDLEGAKELARKAYLQIRNR